MNRIQKNKTKMCKAIFFFEFNRHDKQERINPKRKFIVLEEKKKIL